MEKIYIHLGMQKTASTAMQEFVFPKIKSHNYVYKGDIRDMILSQKNLPTLMSYENYIGYPHINFTKNYTGFMETRENSLRTLSRMFPDAETILIIRDQISLIKSLYNQFIKVGGAVTFEEYISERSKYRLEKEALIYKDLIQRIKDSFTGKLLIIDHKLLLNDADKFEEIFMKFIGSLERGLFSELATKRKNESLSIPQLRAQLFVNSYIKTDFKNDGLKLKSKSFKLVRALSKNVLSHAFRDKDIYSSRLIEDLQDYYKEDQKYVQAILPNSYTVL